MVADILHKTFTSLKIPRLPFTDDGASGSKTLKRSGRAIQDLLEGFASITFPSSERLVAATILQKSLDRYVARLGKSTPTDINETPAVYRDLVEAFQDAGIVVVPLVDLWLILNSIKLPEVRTGNKCE